jgi:hypothetical protein
MTFRCCDCNTTYSIADISFNKTETVSPEFSSANRAIHLVLRAFALRPVTYPHGYVEDYGVSLETKLLEELEYVERLNPNLKAVNYDHNCFRFRVTDKGRAFFFAMEKLYREEA